MPVAYGLTHPVDISLAKLPPSLEGLRIAHVSDLHVRRAPGRRFHQLLNQLTSLRMDLLVLTGDYMETIGHEAHTVQVLRLLVDRVKPRLGTFGVFGNHDSQELRELCQSLPIQWMDSRCHTLADRPIQILGLDTHLGDSPDSVELLLDTQRPENATDGRRPLRLLLSHMPSALPTAADLDVDLVLAGHTHGGQCRLPNGQPLVNSCDMPLHLTAGLFRHRNTLASVSRGIGFSGPIPRFFCKPHVPLYTLYARSMDGQYTDDIRRLRYW